MIQLKPSYFIILLIFVAGRLSYTYCYLHLFQKDFHLLSYIEKQKIYVQVYPLQNLALYDTQSYLIDKEIVTQKDILHTIFCKYSSSDIVQNMTYPWNHFTSNILSPITKDYFRCKGFYLRPPIPIMKEGNIVSNLFDCGGSLNHSLPIRNGKEFIYPILLKLLNYIQQVTCQPVVITSGHRCPAHNHYVDISIKNQFSKHLIGAEVSFYVKGLEENPDVVITCIEEFYKVYRVYDKDEYYPLRRYEKSIDIHTKPWINKEIFLKYYQAHEGRNKDNNHPHPYFSLQVRYDQERHLKVTVSPQEIEHYLHY